MAAGISMCYDPPQQKGAGGMASKFTIWKGRVRLLKSRLGSIFLVLLGIACVLCVLNYVGSTMSKKSSQVSGDFEGNGRRLAAFSGHGHGHKKHKHRKETEESSGEDFAICQSPKLTLESDTIQEAFHKMPALNCTESYSNLFYMDSNGVLRLNKTVLKDQVITRCEYRSILRYNDNAYMYSAKTVRTKDFEVKVQNDFFRVRCFFKDSEKRREYEAERGRFEDYQGNMRRLLIFERHARSADDGNKPAPYRHGDEVHKNPPKLLGSFGLPDLPDNLLHQQAIKAQNEVSKGRDNLDEHSKNEVKQVLLQQEQQQKRHNKKVEKNKEHAAEQKNDEVYEEINLDVTPRTATDDQYDDYEYLPCDYDQFFAHIIPQDDVFVRTAPVKHSKNCTKMNVLIFALDSMSHMAYQRKLPKTYKYLKEILGAEVMDTYNIVGDATAAAMIPLLTGQNEMESPEIRINKEGSQFVDTLPFIWNKFEQQGYTTLFSEDEPSLGTFQLRFNGFEMTPVDHYMRHFWQAAVESEIHFDSPKFCLGGRKEHQYTLDYVKDFFHKYPNTPKFALSFIVSLSHSDNNPAEYIDEDLVAMFEDLRFKGHLENTLVIVMGDHGARYSKVRPTTQGKLEERLPLMSLAFPASFKKKYPELMKNLHVNRNRLTTPYDIHEVLKTVLNIYNAQKPVKNNDRGISLLNVIPADRTCASAGIDMHWCTCLKYEVMKTTNSKAQWLANFVLDYMEEQLEEIKDICHPLKLANIMEALILFPNEKVLKFQKTIDADQQIANFSTTVKLDIVHYQLTIETEPNGGQYEATVREDTVQNNFRIVGEISRVNRYNDDAHCVVKTHPHLRKFCYCVSKPSMDKKVS